jgi:hypothetical protein
MKRWASEKFPQLDPAAEMEAMLLTGIAVTAIATRTGLRPGEDLDAKGQVPALPEYGEQRQRRSDIDKMFG